LPNLIIIAVVLYLQRFCIILPGLLLIGTNLPWAGYNLIVFGTVLIAAGGYLINDYFDIDIDAVNRPDKVAVLKLLRQDSIKKIYFLVALVGIGSIALACYISGTYILLFIYLIATLVLYWYSYKLKKVLILGNLAVAMASAFTLPAAWLFDYLTLAGRNLTNTSMLNYYEISVSISIYCLFAFLLSFAREIIKDIEDMEGDSHFGCKSVPIVFGIPVAKKIISTSFLLTLMMLSIWQIELFKTGHIIIMIYFAIAVDLPLLWLAALVSRIHTKKESHRAGKLTKIIMVTGILSMLLFLF
jgi:4-hydroxybenzoate polyprenyltransferase